MNTIDSYLKTLSDTLVSFGIANKYLVEIIGSIKIRILSLLSHWKDEDIRKAIIFVGKEEGIHYNPQIENKDIASFVVVAIRNSLFETAASVDCIRAGLKEPLSPMQIKEVTEEAIKFFSLVDFHELFSELSVNIKNDYYGKILKKYPCAEAALNALACSDLKETDYQAIKAFPYSFPKQLIMQQNKGSIARSAAEVKLSGITNLIDFQLYEFLKMIAKGEVGFFYSDSLKMISRNFEKLLMVMEYLLSRNKIICTANYFISNGHIEKRERLLKPASSANAIKDNIIRLDELGKLHKEHLEIARKSF